MTVKKSTLVDKLVARLTKDILSGFFASGEQLPPIRTLAKTYDVTVPTVQRAIARLEELGLLSVRHGSGMTVLDPLTHANLMVLPYWVDAVEENVEVKKIVDDFLALRRTIVAEQCAAIGSDDAAWLQIDAAVAEFETLSKNRRTSINDLIKADLNIVRQLIAAKPQVAFSMVFNVYEHLVMQNEQLQAAMYASPTANAASWRELLEQLGNQPKNVRHLTGEALHVVDTQTVSRLG